MLPIAYFLTWTTYGARLHGDAPSSVDRHHNTPNLPPCDPEPKRALAVRRTMRYPPVTLSKPAREVVDAAIREHCDVKKWILHALNVRSNHVHAVVFAEMPPERALTQLKAWSTRALRASGIDLPRVWTEHGSTRWLNSAAQFRGAVEYVRDRQDLPYR